MPLEALDPAPRRSQAERRAETRAKILAGVVESIAEVGLARTTAVEIERRAGVTWGAVQHHFGGKEGLLRAAVEDSFDGFAQAIADVPGPDAAPLALRARLFVERAAEHFCSRSHHCAFEICLDHFRRADAWPGADWRSGMLAAWDREWRRVFGDAGVSAARRFRLEHYAISVLSGLGATLLLEGESARPREGELGFLVTTLVRELGGGATETGV